MKSKQAPVQIEQTNETWQTSQALMAWQDEPTGRKRLWCKACKIEGREWLSPKPCEHIQAAQPEEVITLSEAFNTLREIMNEPVSLPASADPSYPQNSAPADAGRNS